MKYKNRIADYILEEKLKTFGGVLIIGPKGCGKTTSAKKYAKSFIELHDEEMRDKYIQTAAISPNRLLIGDKPKLIDEWQDIPKIWGAIRKSIDDSQEVGLYILTGSSSQEVNTPHSGTTRISRMQMLPMSLYEEEISNGSVSLLHLFNTNEAIDCESTASMNDIIFALCRGGWPSHYKVTDENLKLNIPFDMVTQICNVDINTINGVKRNPIIAESILRTYARNICTNSTLKTMFDDVAANHLISQPTFNEYVSALEKLFVIENIPAWSPNIRSGSVIRVTHKRNFIDPSIAVAVLGISPEYFNNDFKTLGFLFESLCIRDLKIYSSKLKGRVSFYRDKYGLEVDAVLHLQNGKYALIEIKLGVSEIEKAAANLNKIEKLIIEKNQESKKELIRKPDLKIILTASEYGYKRPDGVYVIPIGCLKD